MSRYARRLLLVTALLALAPGIFAPARAAAVTLTVKAVPALQGLDFSFDGTHYTTSKDGTVRIATAPGTHQITALRWRHEDRGIRVAFSRWGDNSFTKRRTVTVRGDRTLQVGYGLSYWRGLSFYDCVTTEVPQTRTGCANDKTRPVPRDRVSRVVLVNIIGEKKVLASHQHAWLEGARVARRLHGLAQTQITYSVLHVRVAGSDVVNQAQQRYYLARPDDPNKAPRGNLRYAGKNFRIRLSLYDARFSTHDLLFRRPVGNALLLTYPNGRKQDIPLVNGKVVLKSMPRGLYNVEVETSAGFKMQVPVSLSRNQNMQLKVISYADLLSSFLVFVLVSVTLVTVRRPTLRAAIRNWIVRLGRNLRLVEEQR